MDYTKAAGSGPRPHRCQGPGHEFGWRGAVRANPNPCLSQLVARRPEAQPSRAQADAAAVRITGSTCRGRTQCLGPCRCSAPVFQRRPPAVSLGYAMHLRHSAARNEAPVRLCVRASQHRATPSCTAAVVRDPGGGDRQRGYSVHWCARAIAWGPTFSWGGLLSFPRRFSFCRSPAAVIYSYSAVPC